MFSPIGPCLGIIFWLGHHGVEILGCFAILRGKQFLQGLIPCGSEALEKAKM
jgi:hypothetical protein